MGDGYDKDRENIPSHERGRIFENGCDRYYKDREHGYMRDSRVYEGRDGRMKVDKINIQLGRTIEEKSGEVKSRKDETQLKVVRELIDRGDINHHTLRTVAGEEISRPARELIGGLLRDYPDKFTHQVVSRDDAREIWARGLQREPGQQLEIPEVGQKARQQRVQQRTKLREEREREQRARVQKAAADRVARTFADKYRELLFRDQKEIDEKSARQRDEADVVERLRQRQRDQADERTRQKQREAADRLAEHARRAREAAERGERGDMSREVLDVLRVSRPTPGIESPHREPPRTSPDRGGREERGRERGHERDRERP